MLALENQPICVLPASGAFSGQVQVFVHQDNSRHLEFGDEWSGTQTSVNCKGPLSSTCLAQFDEDSAVPSCDVVNCPCDRDTTKVGDDYLAKMVNVVMPMCKAAANTSSFTILNIGLGGGDIPTYLLAHCPSNTHIESIEFDPRVASVAGKFFGTDDVHGRHKVNVGDGGVKAAELLSAGFRYDVVLADVFNDAGDVPASCVGEAFAKSVHGLLRPSGKLVQQVWDTQHVKVFSSLENVFAKDAGGSVHDNVSKVRQWVVVATKGSAVQPQA